MAITIRNKATETMIREIGRRWDQGPSATVRRLAERELQQTARSQADIDKDMKAFEELARKYPPPDDGVTWAEIEAEMQSLSDYVDEDDTPDARKMA